jgi:hypothetical protein
MTPASTCRDDIVERIHRNEKIFCGRPVATGSYCSEHRGRVYQRYNQPAEPTRVRPEIAVDPEPIPPIAAQAMSVSDLDITRTTHLCIEQHREQATAHARNTAEEMRRKGDKTGAHVQLERFP